MWGMYSCLPFKCPNYEQRDMVSGVQQRKVPCLRIVHKSLSPKCNEFAGVVMEGNRFYRDNIKAKNLIFFRHEWNKPIFI